MAGRSTNPDRDDPTWVSQSYFARLCGVTRTAIVQHVRAGKFRVAPNGMIDMESPEAQDYLASHRGPPDPALREPKKPAGAKVTPTPIKKAVVHGVGSMMVRTGLGDPEPAVVETVVNMGIVSPEGSPAPPDPPRAPKRTRGTYRGNEEVPGVGASRVDLQTWKLREEVVKLQLANARELKQTVGRELVERMIGVIDVALNRIIMDGRSNLIPQMVEMVRGGSTVEAVQRWWADECGKYIAPVKPHLKKLLKDSDGER